MKKGSRPCAVIDTNLLISAIISSKGLPNKLMRTWENDQIILMISPNLLSELEDVAQRDKFKQYHLFKEQLAELVDNIKASAEVIPSMPDEQLAIHSRDPKDDKLLSCAISADANCLITGDEDLLVLNGDPALGKLKIITAKDFLDLIQ